VYLSASKSWKWANSWLKRIPNGGEAVVPSITITIKAVKSPVKNLSALPHFCFENNKYASIRNMQRITIETTGIGFNVMLSVEYNGLNPRSEYAMGTLLLKRRAVLCWLKY
jgi:hypothetical protein